VLERYAARQMASAKKQQPSLKKDRPVAVTTDEVKGGKKEKRETKGRKKTSPTSAQTKLG